MRRICVAMGGVAFFVMAAAFSGCGGDSGSAPGSGFLTEATPTDFKSTDMTQFKDMMSQTQEHMKKGGYTQRPAPSKQKAADKEKK
jgi:hypothetical protein